MRRRTWLGHISLLPLVGRLAPANTPDPSQVRPTDAAVVYGKLRDLLDGVDGRDLLNKAIERERSAPLDPDVLRYLDEKAPPVLDVLREGAQATECSWTHRPVGEVFEDFFALFMPLHHAARIAILHARRAFGLGADDLAIATLFDAWTCARRISSGRIAVSRLAGIAIERNVIEELAERLPRIPEPLVLDVSRRIVNLPKAADASVTILAERDFARDYIDKNNVGENPPTPEESVEERVVREARKAGRLKDLLDQIDATLELAAKAASGPIDRVESDFQTFAKSVKNVPVVEEMLPNLQGSVRAYKASEIRLLIFKACLSVRLEGPTALSRFRDPQTGKPFALRTWPGGFRLSSAMRYDPAGKLPVSLQVGAPEPR